MTKSDNTYQHGSAEKLGILLVNLGSPDAPKAPEVRRYLAEFLWDHRVVDTPRWLWWPILHGIILRLRPAHAAKAYQKIWTDQGSPLVATTRLQMYAIDKALKEKIHGDVELEFAMRYGNPSIEHGLNNLRQAGARRLLVLPLYPQYSATTTATVFDEVTRVLKNWRWLPEVRFINQYHDHPKYIKALAASIQKRWQKNQRSQKLLFSFHGIPQRYVDSGDPYFCHCQKTARLTAEALELKDEEWMVVFQSRFGREPWLQPYCDKTLQQLPADGIKSLDIICPGFSSDCLETLEEIEIQNRELFIEAGGDSYQYIPALNANVEHIEALSSLISEHCAGWPESSTNWNAEFNLVEENKSRERALKMGAKQ